jgi:phosphoglycolate phosphatase-like HAD superfamily hydrolase
MIEAICGGQSSTPDIEKEVRDYVDYSTGILTIKQMEWLTEAVRRYGLVESVRDPYEYKREYSQRLLTYIDNRLKMLLGGEVDPDDLMIKGSRRFLQALRERNVVKYLASGTDNEYVVKEATALRVDKYFDGGIYGALDHSEANTKEKIIQRILDENNLKGNRLIVVGDGPVEIRNAKSRDAIALGVATDEINRSGLNLRKRKRLMNAGADMIIADFKRSKKLIDYLFT